METCLARCLSHWATPWFQPYIWSLQFQPAWLGVSVTCNQKCLTYSNYNELYQPIFCFLLKQRNSPLWVKEFILPKRHEEKRTIIEHLLCVKRTACLPAQISICSCSYEWYGWDCKSFLLLFPLLLELYLLWLFLCCQWIFSQCVWEELISLPHLIRY